VTFVLTLKVQVESIEFIGNKKFKPKTLLKKISASPTVALSNGFLKLDAEA
jgi:hypothetical protein